MNVYLIHFCLSLISYSFEFTYRSAEPYIVYFPLFYPWWWRWSNLPYSCEFVSDLFFVSIYGDNFLSCIIKHRATLACCCPILFTFYLSYTKTKSILLLILKSFPLWLIVHVINTSFHIHFPLFISWKQNVIFILLNCCRWSAYLFDVNLVK